MGGRVSGCSSLRGRDTGWLLPGAWPKAPPSKKRAARDPQKVEEREEDEHGRDPWKERAEDGRDSWKEEEEEEKEQEEEAEERDEEEDDARHPREQRRWGNVALRSSRSPSSLDPIAAMRCCGRLILGHFSRVRPPMKVPWGSVRAGSEAAFLQISAPNEFDVMFKLKVPRIQLEEYSNSGAYYFVKFKRNPQENPLSQFVEGEFLSASKMLSEFRKIIKQEIKNIKDVAMERKKLGSPAVTLLIGESEEISVDIILALEPEGSWPARTKDGLPVKKWLGGKVRTELRQQPFYLVPKHAKEGQSFQEETWRLSFSHIEKYILSHHGDSKKCCEADGVKCCRKDCLKLMKYLLEQLKKKFNRQELSEFCSYHMKTAFFHLCSKYPLDSDWDPKDLRLCFDNCVAFFLERLRKEELEHYFIPGVNFFSQEYIDTKCKEFLAEKIEYERNNGFPIFGEF
ncbi:Protein MB21D1 [Fukomys damarensis]|uniref:Protein MB21D1 n=1 Tax=Fukomys damarensis TaxID=885580 RepID=A0A091E462_FUKDA|nr:Protein MB21D1 [Fukomys damarensis]